MRADEKKTSFLMKAILTIAGVLCMTLLLGVLCLHLTSLSYLYCLLMEPGWLKSKTRHELESRLFAFYSVRPIDPGLTVWKRQPLRDGQITLRYLIFGKEPLDAIVASNGEIVEIFTAYE